MRRFTGRHSGQGNDVGKDSKRIIPLFLTVQPLPRVRIAWVTEITHVREPYFFVDEQRLGPYAFWHHQHLFQSCPVSELQWRSDHAGQRQLRPASVVLRRFGARSFCKKTLAGHFFIPSAHIGTDVPCSLKPVKPCSAPRIS